MGAGSARNRLCSCGSGLKYKHCCLRVNGNSTIQRIEKSQTSAIFIGDVGKAIGDVYLAFGLSRNASLKELAKRFDVQCRSNGLIYDTYSRITHPVIRRMILKAQLNEQGIKGEGEVDIDAQLNHLGYCLEFARHQSVRWAQSVLDRIVNIRPRNKNAPQEYMACIAELEHLIILAGHGYFTKPFLPDTESKYPDSYLMRNGKKIAIEVCSTANFIEVEKQLAQTIAERLCVKLEKINKCGTHYTLETSGSRVLSRILQNPQPLTQAIVSGEFKITIEGAGNLGIRYRPIPCSLELISTRLNGSLGFAALFPATMAGHKKIASTLSKGIMINVVTAETEDCRNKKIQKAINNAIHHKIGKKQVNLKEFDQGMLVVRLPYNLVIKSDFDLQKMRQDFKQFATIAEREINKSSRFQAVLLMAASHEEKKFQTQNTLRGYLVNGSKISVDRTYFEVPIKTTMQTV